VSSSPRINQDIKEIVVGMPADEAVELVIAHINRTQGFKEKIDTFQYWNKLSFDQKLGTVRMALER
jgi:hypothetical protein